MSDTGLLDQSKLGPASPRKGQNLIVGDMMTAEPTAVVVKVCSCPVCSRQSQGPDTIVDSVFLLLVSLLLSTNHDNKLVLVGPLFIY